MSQDVPTTSNKSDSELAEPEAPTFPSSYGNYHLNYFKFQLPTFIRGPSYIKTHLNLGL